MHAVLLLLNAAFWAFHTALILFNVFGWIWRGTRRWNLLTLTLTAASWFVMGLRYGIGYCICTDWHFQVRAALGIHDGEDTYIQLLVAKATGWWAPVGLLNAAAGIVFGVSVAMSVALNVRDWRRARL